MKKIKNELQKMKSEKLMTNDDEEKTKIENEKDKNLRKQENLTMRTDFLQKKQ